MVDSKSKIRLAIVSVVLLCAIGYMIFSASASSYVSYKQIGEVVKDKSLVGKGVEVAGKVKPKSVVHKGTEMTFVLAENSDTIDVTYTGQVPQTFGDNVQAVVTGKLVSQNKVVAESIVTKCPSKYEGKDVNKMTKDQKK
jgi:cytochrome c-type biogenesis protein CcmE